MCTKTILTLFFSIITFTLVAQHQVIGRVFDRDHQPISYASIALLQASDSLILKGSLTDAEGRFNLNKIVQGTYRIRISSLGFSDLYTPLFNLNTDTLTINLSNLTLLNDGKLLETIEVKTHQSLISQKVDRIILNVDGSILTRGNKVEDLLQYAPRVRYENGNISVGNKSNVLVLVDSRQMGQGSLTGFLQTFAAEDILRIEIITNPSARYDASFDAVINIITKKSLEQGINGRTSIGYSQGQYSRSSANGSINYRLKKWNFFSSLNVTFPSILYSSQSVYRRFPETIQQNEIETVNINRASATNIGIDYAFNNHHTFGLRINGKWDQDNKETRTFTQSIAKQTIDSTLRTINEGVGNTRTYDINLNYKALFGQADAQNGSRELIVNFTESLSKKEGIQVIQYQTVHVDSTNVSPTAYLRIINPNKQKNLIGQIDFGTPVFGGTWRMDIGTKYVFIQNDNDLQQQNLINGQYITNVMFSNAGIYRERTYALYTSFSRKFGTNWFFQGGIRSEQTEQKLTQLSLTRTYISLFPSFSLNRALSKGKSWGLTLSRKINRPNLSILVPYRYIIDPYTFLEGNPLIKPAFSHTVDAFYSLGNINLFVNYSYIRNQITAIVNADEKTGQYTQISGNLLRGNDFYLGITYFKNFLKYWQSNTTVMGMGNFTKSPVNELSTYRASGQWLTVNSTNIISLPHDWKYELSFQYISPARSGLYNQKGFGGVSMSVNKSLFTRRANIRLVVNDVFRTMYNRLVSNYGLVDYTIRSYYDSQRAQISFSYNFGKKTVKVAREHKWGNEDEKGRMSR